jgi:hypothetical protein
MEQEPQEEKSYEEILEEINGLSLANDPEKIKDFIVARLAYLKQGIIKRVMMSPGADKPIEGFIAETTEIKRASWVDGLLLNDEQIYSMIFEELKNLRTQNQFENATLRNILPLLIYRVISKYFGNFFADETIEPENEEFYLDRSAVDSPPVSLSELKGKGFSVCVERAAMAQNLLSFVGLNPILVMGKLQLADDQTPTSLHLFNVVKSPKGYSIFETIDPTLTFDKNDQIIGAGPIIYPISESDALSIKNGGLVEVTHTNSKQMEDGTYQHEYEKRTYSGTKAD